MGELTSIPRHDPPFAKEDINRLLADERYWFNAGSTLFRAATILLDDLKTVPDTDVIVVGKPIARDISDADGRRREREIVPAMLFGMAVECWLKGFLVKMMPRASKKTRKQWETVVHEGIDPADLSDGYLEKLSVAFEKKESKELQSKLEQQQQNEDEQRVQAVRKHGSHALQHLAAEAGLEKLLKEHDHEYLEFLSSAIESGRYPVSYRPERVIPWDGIASEQERWDSLNAAIGSRYDELLVAEGVLDDVGD